MIAKEFNPSIDKSYYITRHLLLDALKSKVSLLHGNMLDFGCGSKPYRSLIHVDEYIGCDYNGDGHSHENEDIEIYYDGKTLPFFANEFDSIFSTECFEHIFDLEEVIAQLYMCLRIGGIMIFTMPFIIAEHEVPNDCSRYTSYGIKNLLERKGFTILKQEKIGTSIQTQFQMRMSYLDSYVICKFKKIKLYKPVAAITFTVLNLMCMFFNWLLPKKQDAFLNHIIICKK